MNITYIKNKLDNRIGDNVKIIYNGSRNKKEEYSGIITETYNYIFVTRNLSLNTRDYIKSKKIRKNRIFSFIHYFVLLL